MTDRTPIRRALLGVYDKSGIEELAAGLAAAGVELVSTGATARRIAEAGIPVTPVEQVTGFPECLDGRVKTLHPAVHAGILADRRKPDHVRQLEELGIAPFDLVVVNLYPFTETVASGASPDECVEQIDIGGPAMVRASAKNHPSVAVVVDPARYADVLTAVAAGGFTLAERQKLAAAAFRHTATYDIAVASWLGNVVAPDDDSGFPAWVGATWDRADVLRYGENPHQKAALYRSWQLGLAHAEQLHGVAGRARPRRPLRRDHQARQPVRDRRRPRHRLGAPQGPRLRPDLGVRRRDRGQPGDRSDDGRAGVGGVHRSRRGAVLHR
jgi:phosphoribosylaminoimidazolecarboxamide formyltransferase / IMP cyclohydrolase